LGFKIIELSRKAAGQNRIAQESRAMIVNLHDRFQESVYIGVYRRGRVVMIDMLPSPHAVRVVVDLGEQCHLHASALGRSVAAYLPENKLRERLDQAGMPKLTKNTIVSYKRLRAVLAEIRSRGYAINREETVEGAVCVGAPFFAGDAGVLGAAAISIPVCRATDALVDAVGAALVDAASMLSAGLSGFPAEPDTLPRARLMTVA
jgi:IclR family acetate operon transcriptional repressor